MCNLVLFLWPAAKLQQTEVQLEQYIDLALHADANRITGWLSLGRTFKGSSSSSPQIKLYHCTVHLPRLLRLLSVKKQHSTLDFPVISSMLDVPVCTPSTQSHPEGEGGFCVASVCVTFWDHCALRSLQQSTTWVSCSKEGKKWGVSNLSQP